MNYNKKDHSKKIIIGIMITIISVISFFRWIRGVNLNLWTTNTDVIWIIIIIFFFGFGIGIINYGVKLESEQKELYGLEKYKKGVPKGYKKEVPKENNNSNYSELETKLEEACELFEKDIISQEEYKKRRMLIIERYNQEYGSKE